MKRLTAKTKYSYHVDGHAIIYACLKGTTKFIPTFVCHAYCIPLVIAAQSLQVENVVLKPYTK